MERIKRTRRTGWRAFWHTVLIMLVGIGLIAVGFFGAMFVTQALM